MITCTSCARYKVLWEVDVHGSRRPKPVCEYPFIDPVSGREAEWVDAFAARLSPYMCGDTARWWIDNEQTVS